MGWSGLPERFEKKIIPEPNSGCWLWLGALGHRGHPHINKSYGTQSGHRFIYQTLVGSVPQELVVDHWCNNPSCVNPDHLRPLTYQNNTLRSPITVAAKYAVRTHCKRGHEFTPENTLSEARSNARICLACRQAAAPQRIAYAKAHPDQMRKYSREYMRRQRGNSK